MFSATRMLLFSPFFFFFSLPFGASKGKLSSAIMIAKMATPLQIVIVTSSDRIDPHCNAMLLDNVTGLCCSSELWGSTKHSDIFQLQISTKLVLFDALLFFNLLNHEEDPVATISKKTCSCCIFWFRFSDENSRLIDALWAATILPPKPQRRSHDADSFRLFKTDCFSSSFNLPNKKRDLMPIQATSCDPNQLGSSPSCTVRPTLPPMDQLRSPLGFLNVLAKMQVSRHHDTNMTSVSDGPHWHRFSAEEQLAQSPTNRSSMLRVQQLMTQLNWLCGQRMLQKNKDAKKATVSQCGVSSVRLCLLNLLECVVCSWFWSMLKAQPSFIRCESLAATASRSLRKSQRRLRS